MKIEKLIIHGFGKHEEVTVELGTGMNVLYGLNEAGKTTIQQFILHVLFGFPQKNSALLRYEPRSGGKYGGRIVLVDELHGRCTVERIRGKSAGDVTVRLEDGTTGGEELLQILLRHYDRSSYESIFSFSLLQLQGFEKMDEEELSRTLLASGTTGVDTLLKLEKRMEKEMTDLFKKSGRLPEMNSKLAELRSLEADLKIEREKMDAYEPSIKRLREIEERLLALQQVEKETKAKHRLLTLHQQLLPLQKKGVSLEARLAQLGPAEFPIDGIRRYETLDGKLKENNAMEQKMLNELTALKSQIPAIEDATRIEEMESLLAKESDWLSWHTIVTAAEEEQRQVEAEKGRLFDRLGVKNEDRQKLLFGVDVSLQKQEELEVLLRNLANFDQQRNYTELQFNELEKELSELEEKIRLHNQSAPTAEERKAVQDWPTIRDKLAEARAYISLGGTTPEKNSTSIILLTVALFFIVYGFIRADWLVLIAGGVVAAFSLFYFVKKKPATADSKMQEMERVIDAYQGKAERMTGLLNAVETFDREVTRMQADYHSLTTKYHQVEALLDGIFEKRKQAEEQLRSFLAVYGFDDLPSGGIIPELFRMIRELQELERAKEYSLVRAQKVEQQLAHRKAELEKILQKEVPHHSIYEMLRRDYLRLKEEAETARVRLTAIAKMESDLISTKELAGSLTKDLQRLMIEAETETEKAFYEAFDRQQERMRLTEQLNDVVAQLEVYGPLELSQQLTEFELQQNLVENDKGLAAVSEELNELFTEQASLLHKTEQLLSEESLGLKRQLFEMKKAEFAELTTKWSERKAVAEAIRRTMSDLKEKTLPTVLEEANRLFRALTEGAYDSLEVSDTGRFEALAVSGMRHPIVELSQATKEQAYIALRFALASSLTDSAPFPILMDDPFVHFDGKRLSRMIELLDTLQQTHQFIYFTCHETMKDHWMDATILNVSELGSGQEEVRT